MSATASSNARLRYLTDAAHLLLARAPAVSAALGSERNRLFLQQQQQQQQQQDAPRGATKLTDACIACGAVLAPGVTCSVELLPRARARAGPAAACRTKRLRRPESADARQATKPASSSRKLPRLLEYACHRCGRATRVALPRAEKRAAQPLSLNKLPVRRAAAAAAATPVLGVNVAQHAAKAYEKIEVDPGKPGESGAAGGGGSTAKKRAKARKQGGLQAMLAKSVAADAAREAKGLDLMDFLKSE